uniref:Uncharacterized protein n=1 Tax=Rhizophora mucronata TaxID=61149 RepID=A0A2P2INB2_RHIMU
MPNTLSVIGSEVHIKRSNFSLPSLTLTINKNQFPMK